MSKTQKVTIMNGAVAQLYYLVDEYTPTSLNDLNSTEALFRTIADHVIDHETVLKALQEEGKMLQAKSKSTNLKMDVRKQAEEDLEALNGKFVEQHEANCEIDFDQDVAEFAITLIQTQLSNKVVKGRRNVREIHSAYESLKKVV